MNAVEVFNFLIPKLSLCYSAIGKYLIRMALQQTKHFYQNLVVIFLLISVTHWFYPILCLQLLKFCRDDLECKANLGYGYLSYFSSPLLKFCYYNFNLVRFFQIIVYTEIMEMISS